MQASSSTKTFTAGEENSAKGDENSGEEEHVRQVKTVELPEEEASTMEVESKIGVVATVGKCKMRYKCYEIK